MQPHSGSQANAAAYMAVLPPGDTILGLDLAHGGHLTHGHKLNFSRQALPGRVYQRASRHGNDRLRRAGSDCGAREAEDDHRRRQRLSAAVGFRADAARLRTRWARLYVVDMAHFAGLVAGGVHPSPVPHAHIVTTTTHKTLRGPRAGMILCAGRSLRQGHRPQRVSRAAGRPAGAHHRGQGGGVPRSAAAGVSHVRDADRGERARRWPSRWRRRAIRIDLRAEPTLT